MGRKDTAFSFHCMICFEEFDNTNSRYPVVLPCGHTYVCNTCGERLEKCMECRTPLYMTFNLAEINNSNVGNKNLTSALSSNHNISNSAHSGASSSSSSHLQGSLSRTSTWTSARAGGSTRHGPNHHSFNNQQQPPKKPPPVLKKRLPLPKNVVLLSLIEATELASADAAKELAAAEAAAAAASANNEDTNTTAAGATTAWRTMSTDEDSEDIKISLATSLAVGVVGTYAVAAREGLEIFPSRPSQYPDVSLTCDEDVDTLVQFFHMDKMDSQSESGSGGSNVASVGIEGVGAGAGTGTSTDGTTDTAGGGGIAAAATSAATTDGTTKSFEKAHLSFADRVQIVSVEDGWAKLARGYGYVRADKNQLVKVGSPVDRACKLEAMLRTLSYTRKELRLQQSQVDNEFIRLMNDLQVSLQNDEDLTVICGTAFCLDNSNNSSSSIINMMDNSEHSSTTATSSTTPRQTDMVEEKKESSTPKHHHQNSPLSSPTTAAFSNDHGVVSEDHHYPQKPTDRPMVVADIESIRTGIMCFAPSALGIMSCASGDSDYHDGDVPNSNQNHNNLQLSSSTPFSLSEMAASGRQLLRSSDVAGAAALFPAASHPSPSEMRAGAQAWRERQSANADTAGTTGIDFRTGLSGHMALLSSHAHTHELLDPNSSIRLAAARAHSTHRGTTVGKSSTRLKMSSHTGLTSSKPFNLKSLFQAWNSPSRSNTTDGGAGHHQALKHAGSM